MTGNHLLNPSEAEMDAWLFPLALVFFLSGSLVLLGPGGYSLDARLSGWRTIRLEPREVEGPAASDIFLTEGLRPSSVYLDTPVKGEETDWRDYLDSQTQ